TVFSHLMQFIFPVVFCFLVTYCCLRDRHSFPTRRYSDLTYRTFNHWSNNLKMRRVKCQCQVNFATRSHDVRRETLVIFNVTRTRSEEHTLNSSHVKISYADFCLKKKNNKQ